MTIYAMNGFSQYKKTLVNLGLNEKESEVYLTLNQLGPTSAYRIAERSGIKRSTVYLILDELRKKGLVLKIPKENKQIFTARPLEEYLDDKQKALAEGQRLAETLKDSGVQTNLEVRYYEGVSGIEQAVNFGLEELEGTEASAIFGHLTDQELLPVFENWHKKASLYSNFRLRALINNDQYRANFQTLANWNRTASYIETRILKLGSLPQDFSFEVFKKPDKAWFLRIIADKPQHATLIETTAVAAAFWALFEALWQQSENVDW